MGLLDALHFDSDEYQAKLSGLTDERLHLKHRQKSMQVGQYTACAALSFYTSRGTLVDSAYSMRQLFVVSQQIDLIEEEFQRRRARLPQLRARDCIAGAAIGAGVAAIGSAVSIGVHPLVDGAILGTTAAYAVNVATHGAASSPISAGTMSGRNYTAAVQPVTAFTMHTSDMPATSILNMKLNQGRSLGANGKSTLLQCPHHS